MEASGGMCMGIYRCHYEPKILLYAYGSGKEVDPAPSQFDDSRANLRLLLLRAELLREGGTIMVYSYDVTAGEKGFLRVGEAIKVDRLVFVPGCFHHLVLRSQEYTIDNSIRWKLVGLVAMITTKTQRRDYSKTNGHNSVETGLCINTALDKLGYVLD